MLRRVNCYSPSPSHPFYPHIQHTPGFIGWSGCIVLAFWLIHNSPSAPEPSVGFPGYIYPDAFEAGSICNMYQGVPCTFQPGKCCYNTALHCPGYDGTPSFPCNFYDRGAYPTGDHAVYPNSMTSAYAYSPYPNGIFWNWATVCTYTIAATRRSCVAPIT
jgi:hypothetical protein